jgi:quaternary ammonium compound-resistance protein SugE
MGYASQETTMTLAWIYLLVAGLLEIGWPLGFKLSQTTSHRITYIVVAVVCMGLSGLFLWLAQRDIPIGTAYAVWTGIGAAGTFLIGLVIFHDPVSMMRVLSFLLIVAGVIGLKISA